MTATLLKYPDPKMTAIKPRDVKVVGAPEVQRLIKELLRTMYHRRGLSLCARQVGSALRIVVLNATNDRAVVVNRPPHEKVFVNPVIGATTGELKTEDEFCLSMPGVAMPVARPESCVVTSLSPTGKMQLHDLRGLEARAFMHALDLMDRGRFGTIEFQ